MARLSLITDLGKQMQAVRIATWSAFLLLAQMPLYAGEMDDALTAYHKGDLDRALTLFQPQAEKGNPVAARYIGEMYETGDGVAKDDALALKWLRMAAEKGDAEAQFRMGVIYSVGTEAAAKNQEESLAWMRKAAAQDHPLAKKTVAIAEAMPINGAKMDAMAAGVMQMMIKGAEAGNAETQRDLANAYGAGGMGPRDPAKELYWYRKSAENGNVPSQIMLGLYYRDGIGVPKDHTQAKIWLEKAASKDLGDMAHGMLQQMAKEDSPPDPAPVEFEEVRRKAETGDPKAQIQLGQLYCIEHTVVTSYAKAAEWYGKAAAQGDVDGELKLADLYSQGKGVVRNTIKASLLYRQAADQGSGAAQYRVAGLYAGGMGDLPEDDTKALALVRKSAENGYGPAEYDLGKRYAEGTGVAKDRDQAIAWLQKASAAPDTHAFEKRMAQSTIAKLEKESAH